MLSAQRQHTEISIGLGAVARALRQVLQVALLGLGAWLVIDKQASAGVMVAGTILLGRALQHVEHLIGGWRALIDARGAWHRLGQRRIESSSDTLSIEGLGGDDVLDASRHDGRCACRRCARRFRRRREGENRRTAT